MTEKQKQEIKGLENQAKSSKKFLKGFLNYQKRQSKIKPIDSKNIHWKPSNKPPKSSRTVLITDGKNLVTANYWVGNKQWCNQFEHLIGNRNINESKITHWADLKELGKILP